MQNRRSNNPIFDLLARPDNAGPACEIYNAFPDVLNLLKLQLFKAVCVECRKRLQTKPGWKVVLDPDNDPKLFEEKWPAIYVAPHYAEPDWHCWYFNLQMNAAD